MVCSDDNTTFYVPSLERPRRPPPRISGTAVVGGVHLSTGSYGTAPWWQLLLGGLGIAALLGTGVALTFIELWCADRVWGLGFAPALLGTGPAGALSGSLDAGVVIPVVSFANFLLVMRLSPMSGYHAAEHKVVAAIEAHCDITWDTVLAMPRAHPRCGTVLLLGVLPAVLIAYPLWQTDPTAALLVAAAGWLLRYRVGYLIQQHLTTKAPTPQQLNAGITAGRKLLQHWRDQPDRPVSIARNLWNRGLPQLLAGMTIGLQTLTYLGGHLHLLLDR